MEKTLSIREWTIIKRTAMNVQPLVAKKQRLTKQISDLTEEAALIDKQIDCFELGIKDLCGGLGTEQLVNRVVTPIEGKFDKDGKQQRKTSYEPSSIVTFDKEHNNYIVHIPDEVTAPEDEVNTQSGNDNDGSVDAAHTVETLD